MPSRSPLRKYIENGAKLLDKRIPNWPTLIDLTHLDLESTKFCVVGQLYNHSYDLGVVELDLEDTFSARFHGFDVPVKDNLGVYYSYATLTREWKKYIKERLGVV